MLANADPNLPQFEKFGRMISPSEDPTKSLGLRARWVRQVRVRHNQEMAWVRKTVGAEDVFDLRGEGGRLSGFSPTQQIQQFMQDLKLVQMQTVVEEPGGVPWITPFVREAYAKGLIRGNRDLRALARGQRRSHRTTTGNSLTIVNQDNQLFEAPTLDPDNIQDALQAGERARLFELEVFRTWQGITDVTAQVNAQVAMVIANGLESQATPAQLAKDINGRIDKVGKTRSEMIARTETVAANNRGAVAEFAEAERLAGFDVNVQWETSLDSRVRDTHIVRHGDVYTKEVGLSLVGESNCRCALLPYIPAIEGEVDLSSGKAALALTPDQAKAPAKRERKKLDVPQVPPGGSAKKRK